VTFNYRFSVIPAGAITDSRLTPRALQVLCLLGRHTNDAGWCSRSQVKMARELQCSRSTIYDALILLFESEWVERRPNGRGSRAPVEGEQPFAAYSYRVILDREALPARVAEESKTEVSDGSETAPDSASEPAGEGAAQAAGGADIAAGGADMAAPLEGISSKGISSEPERDSARAHEKKASGLAMFEARWPTAAADDRQQTAYAWEALTETERDDALGSIGAFLDDLKRHRRSHPCAGWKYLSQKRWQLLAKSPDPSQLRPVVSRDSDEGRAWAAIYAVAHASMRDEGATIALPRALTPQELALAHAPPQKDWIFIAAEQVHQVRAWNDLVASALAGRARGQLVWERTPSGKRGFMAPWSFPPLKDGSIPRGPPADAA
jgi:hypothetical protein